MPSTCKLHVGLFCLTARAALRLISPYCLILALNRMEFPEGFSCRHSNPIRYIVRGASHPVISATVARPRRRLAGIFQVHVYYRSLTKNAFPYNNIHIQSCDIVSQLTSQITGSKKQSDEGAALFAVRVNLLYCYVFSFFPRRTNESFPLLRTMRLRTRLTLSTSKMIS